MYFDSSCYKLTLSQHGQPSRISKEIIITMQDYMLTMIALHIMRSNFTKLLRLPLSSVLYPPFLR